MFCHRRAMQVEIDRIHALGQRLFQVLQDVAGDALKSVLRHKRGGAGPRPHRGPQLPAHALGRVNKAPHRNIHPSELGLHRLAAYIRWKRIASVERCPVRQAGRKSVCLVLKARDEDLGHAPTPGALAIKAWV